MPTLPNELEMERWLLRHQNMLYTLPRDGNIRLTCIGCKASSSVQAAVVAADKPVAPPLEQA